MNQKYYRDELYDRMVDEWELFDRYTDFFMFAATVGYAVADKQTVDRYEKEDFTGSENDDSAHIYWEYISNQQSYRVISASIAYQHTNEYEILTDPSEQLEVLARYARAGVKELNEEFGDNTNSPRDGVISYIDGWIEDDVEEDDGEIFNEIISSFDEDIYS